VEEENGDNHKNKKHKHSMYVSVWRSSGCQYKVQCLWDKLIFVARPLILCPCGTVYRVNKVNVLLTPWQRLKGPWNHTLNLMIQWAHLFLKL